MEEVGKVEEGSALSTLDIVAPFIFNFFELLVLEEGGEIDEDDDEDEDEEEMGVSIQDIPVQASLE